MVIFTALPPPFARRTSGIHLTQGWVAPNAELDTVNIKTSILGRVSISDCSVFQDVDIPNYPGSRCSGSPSKKLEKYILSSAIVAFVCKDWLFCASVIPYAMIRLALEPIQHLYLLHIHVWNIDHSTATFGAMLKHTHTLVR
jgi:hypothetical protein